MTDLKFYNLKKMLQCDCCGDEKKYTIEDLLILFELLADIFDYDLYFYNSQLAEILETIN